MRGAISVAPLATFALLATVVAAACGLIDSPSASPEVIQPTPVVTLGPSETPLPTSGVVIDSGLLGLLPESVDGLAITENTAGEAASLGDPLLDQVAAAFASGFATDPAGTEFVYAVVVGLLPEVMDETVFRDWRDSYDEGACSQADGVLGHAETEIDGRTVYIGTCVGGLRTYHVWLEENEVLISASAVGERRLGELLVENLRP